MGLKEHVVSRLRRKQIPEHQRLAELDSDFFDVSVRRTLPLFDRATKFLDSMDIEKNIFDMATISAMLAELDARERIETTGKSQEEMEKRKRMMGSLRRMTFVTFTQLLPEEEQERLRDPLTLKDYEAQARRAAENIFGERATKKDIFERRMKHSLPPSIVMMKYYRSGKAAQ